MYSQNAYALMPEMSLKLFIGDSACIIARRPRRALADCSLHEEDHRHDHRADSHRPQPQFDQQRAWPAPDGLHFVSEFLRYGKVGICLGLPACLAVAPTAAVVGFGQPRIQPDGLVIVGNCGFDSRRCE